MKIEITLDPSKNLREQLRPMLDLLANGAVDRWSWGAPKPFQGDQNSPAAPEELREKVSALAEQTAVSSFRDDNTKEDEAPKKRGRPKKAEAPVEKPVEALPEPVADPEDDEQDEADEIAEVEATAPKELTIDDVRSALADYANTFGMPAAMEDGVKILKAVFPTQEYRKVSQIPAEDYARTIDAFRQAVKLNPYGRSAA